MRTVVTLDKSNAGGFLPVVELRNFLLPITRFSLARAEAGPWRFDMAVMVPDRDTAEPRELHWAMFWPLTMTDKEVVNEIYLTVYNMLIHELAEAWIVNNERCDDPHGTLGSMSAMRAAEEWEKP